MRIKWTLLLALIMLLTAGCYSSGKQPTSESGLPGGWIMAEELAVSRGAGEGDQQLDSNVYYEIFVRAFADSDGDGIGDFRGIVDMLDYLNDGDPATTGDLGVSGIWLMPIHPSPSYHGYDVTDYYGVNPEYGTMEDFRLLLEEAHKRDIKVIIDLVVNHTSTEHPWFQSALKDPSSEYRNWYVWREEGVQVSSTSATGGQAWHRSSGGQYLGVFWSGMPDLNFAHEPVRQEMINIGRYWLELGVDGFRLDAAKHIFEDLSGDEKKPALQEANLAWWQEFREGLEQVRPDVYLVGEVWESSPARVAPYYQVFDSTFNFAAGELIISAASKEADSNVAFTLERVLGAYAAAAGKPAMDAPFLTNHDQNRVMSTLRGNIDQAKMAASVLLTLPGRPFIYYGEEIGMQGVKPDEEIREPMKWADDAEIAALKAGEADAGSEASGSLLSADQYAAANTSWRLPRHQADTSSVLAQDGDPDSLLNHYRALIHLRSMLPVLIDGSISQVDLEPVQLMAYERRSDADRVLVVHNLGAAEVKVDLGAAVRDAAYERVIAASREGIGWTESGGSKLLTLPPYSTAILRQ
jgi:glycosidase